MKLEEAVASLTDEQKQELATLKDEKEIRNYLIQQNIELEENYELSDDDLDNVTGGLDMSYIIRILLKRFGVVEKGEEVLSSIIGGNNSDNNNNNNNTSNFM